MEVQPGSSKATSKHFPTHCICCPSVTCTFSVVLTATWVSLFALPGHWGSYESSLNQLIPLHVDHVFDPITFIVFSVDVPVISFKEIAGTLLFSSFSTSYPRSSSLPSDVSSSNVLSILKNFLHLWHGVNFSSHLKHSPNSFLYCICFTVIFLAVIDSLALEVPLLMTLFRELSLLSLGNVVSACPPINLLNISHLGFQCSLGLKVSS